MNVSSVSSAASIQKPVQAPPPAVPAPTPAPVAAKNDGDADDKGGSAPRISNSVASALSGLKIGG